MKAGYVMVSINSDLAGIDFTTPLDKTIQYPYPRSKNLFNPDKIFLTGATGLLGANLLGELLHTTRATVYCLVRASGVDDGRARLKEKLQLYSFWQENFNSRVIPVIGNLEQQNLGIPDSQFLTLAKEVDIIFHCGACVNMIYSYSQLKAANVSSTECLLRFAGLYKTKAFHYISSLSVFAGMKKHLRGKKIYLETDHAILDPDLQSGYIQTKIVSERFIHEAQQRGLPVCVYRTGKIMGHSKTGIMSNDDDLLCIIWKACVILKQAPVINEELTFLPADFTSGVIGCLSRKPSALGKTFHIYNHHSISWMEVFKIMKDFGYPLELVAFDQWGEALKQKVKDLIRWDSSDKSAMQMSFLDSVVSEAFKGHTGFSTFNTSDVLQGVSMECPAVDVWILRNYLEYLEKVGFLPEARSNVVERWKRRAAMKGW